MCGVIGYFSNKGCNDIDEKIIKEILVQSQIRGKHAAGLSFIEDNKVKTIKGDFYISELAEVVNLIGKKSLIAHARYSTSDLRFNQPISDGKLSIVHNGVITQESPDKWKNDFGYECSTANDSELLFHSSSLGNNPLIEFQHSSIAAIELRVGNIRFYRNGTRPLWFTFYNDSVFIASTKDILHRSFINILGIDSDYLFCRAGIIYDLSDDGDLVEESIKFEDQQNFKFNCVNNYKKVQL